MTFRNSTVNPVLTLGVLLALAAGPVRGAETLTFYYAHPAAADHYGVIAPWYTGQNGQLDYRIRIAAETLKRYPWAAGDKAVAPAPEYVYNGSWNIDPDGTITSVAETDWNNGDLGQRAAYILGSVIDYYAYSGDPAVFTPITATADYLIDYCQTDEKHSWPKMLISVPSLGTRYGRCVAGKDDGWNDRQGKIQLDITAQLGYEFVRAYKLSGNKRYYDAARNWADLIARNRSREPGEAPWGRYASHAPGGGMNGIQTGGVGIILQFFDELIRTGYTGENGEIIKARDAGRAFLRDELLPNWTAHDTWGRNFWDWEANVQELFGTEFPILQMLEHKDAFPNWKNDVRNILGLFLNRAGADVASSSEVFHGAWAYPESSGCCWRSLGYSPMEISALFARYGVEAESDWAREIARRSQILATYDVLPDGHAMDVIDGGAKINLLWFKIAHPMALKYLLRTMSWLPEIFGPQRENHIVRSSGVIPRVEYLVARIAYSTFDAPPNSVEVLRLSYKPNSVRAAGVVLSLRADLTSNGYTVSDLTGGDSIVSIRHDGATEVVIEGPDPQKEIPAQAFTCKGNWRKAEGASWTSAEGASIEASFTGNQARLIASTGPLGGRADVYLDGVKQLGFIDFHSPVERKNQILFSRNGLSNGPHSLKIVAQGAHNPLSSGSEINVSSLLYSGETSHHGFGEGGGPSETQRMIFGYTGRKDYKDSEGRLWRPGTEFLVRLGRGMDTVARTWWTMKRAAMMENAPDRDLYDYGIHAPEFIINITVGPGKYHARLKFAETEFEKPNERGITISINDEKRVESFDIVATAGGWLKPVDLVFNDIVPKNGVIEIRLVGQTVRGIPREAILQALEVGPGGGGAGANPKSVALLLSWIN